MKRSRTTRGSHAGAAAIVMLMALLAAEIAAAEVGKEPFKGSCEDLNDFIRRAGVTDASNQNHPRSAGWTSFEVTSAPYQMTFRPGKGEGQACLESALTETAKMFSVSYRVTRLEWQPFGSITNDCAAEKARWERATEERERRHLEAAETSVEKYNKAWSAVPHRYRACAESEALARDNLRQQAEKDVQKETKRIKAELLTLPGPAHEPADSGNAGLDCSKCSNR